MTPAKKAAKRGAKVVADETAAVDALGLEPSETTFEGFDEALPGDTESTIVFESWTEPECDSEGGED